MRKPAARSLILVRSLQPVILPAGMRCSISRSAHPLADAADTAIISITVRVAPPPLPMAIALPGFIEPVIPTAEAAEAAGASLRDLAGFRASHGLRQASLCLDL